ncbi:MAG: hypothetical protein ACRDHF_07500 [Tepidiformaceae bacterium]
MTDIRVSPPKIFPQVARAPKPPADAGGSADAYRQTAFVLGADVDLVLRGLELEAAIAEASSDAKHRTQTMVAALGLWSRAWLSRQQALQAVQWGNYAAAIPLVRAAADYQASGLYVLRDGGQEWQQWLDEGGISLAPDEHAIEYRLHAFRAAEVLAAHDILGPIYRVAMDLSMPHFGATLLIAGNASDPARVAMTFGDRDFHLALAEICLGWTVMLSVAALEAAVEFEGVFNVPDRAAIDSFGRDGRAAIDRDDRAGIDTIEREGERRYLVANWRRRPGDAREKILL